MREFAVGRGRIQGESATPILGGLLIENEVPRYDEGKMMTDDPKSPAPV
jgi:hypothetical protein